MAILFILLIFLIINLTVFIFHVAFVRGEIFDITKMKVGRRCKLNTFLNEFESNLEWINKLNFELHSIKSDDGLNLVAKFYRVNNSNKLVILFHRISLYCKK